MMNEIKFLEAYRYEMERIVDTLDARIKRLKKEVKKGGAEI